MKIKSLHFFIFFIVNIQAQNTVLSSGNDAVGNGGTISYSIGQITYTEFIGSNGSINQGIQHSFEIFTLGTDVSPEIKLLMMVYPNPTTSSISLKTGNNAFETLEYQLFDMNGKQITIQKITQEETQIQMEKLGSGIYFLKVSDNKKILKTFKIIKNN